MTKRHKPKMGFHKQQLSPVSPFQFGSYGDLASPSSNSTVSSLEARNCLENDVLSYGSSPPGISSYVLETATFSDILRTHQRLRDSMNQARHLNCVINRTDEKLESMFSRLSVIEIPVASMCSKSSLVQALSFRINAAMTPTCKLLRAFDMLHHLQDDVAGGPKGDVGRYLEIITRFEKCVSFIRESCPRAVEQLQQAVDFVCKIELLDNFRMLKLNETLMALRTLQFGQEHTNMNEEILEEALEHLETEFRRILTDYGAPLSLQNVKIDNSPPLRSPLPAPVIQILQEIAAKLAAHGRLKNCLEIYQDVRSWKAGQSLQTLHPQYLQHTTSEATDKLEWGALEDNIAQWMQHIQIFVNILLASESRFCQQIFSSIDTGLWSKCFGSMAMTSGLTSFVIFGEAVAKSQKEPHKLFKMLEMFDVLEKMRPHIERIFEGSGRKIVKDQMKELQKKTVLGACRIFWEFGLQVEMQGEGGIPPDGSVLRLASYVVNYIKYLLSDFYGSTMAEVLKISQSWRGENTEGKSSELPRAILDIMESLERNIESRANKSDDPALANLFLVNNHRYIYSRSRGNDLGALLGDAWLKHHERKMEKHALEYQKAAWGSVLLKLSGDGMNLSSSSKLRSSRELLRQRIEGFQSAFDDLCQRHRRWSIPDTELREQLGLAVLQSVVEAYRNYLDKFGSLLQLGTPVKFKYSPDDIEQKLTQLFDQEMTVRKSSQIVNGMPMFYSN